MVKIARVVPEISSRTDRQTHRHLGNIPQLCRNIYSRQPRHVSTIGKKLNNNISTCPYNMANFGQLTDEIGSGVWGTPANFNGFRVLASLLQRRRSTEANQILHDVWPSHGLVHCIYVFGGSCSLTEFRYVQIHFASKSCVLLYWQRYCTALQQRRDNLKTLVLILVLVLEA